MLAMPPYLQTVLIRKASAKCGKLQKKQFSFGYGAGCTRKKIVILLVFNELNNLHTLSVDEAFMKTKDVLSAFFKPSHSYVCRKSTYLHLRIIKLLIRFRSQF
jgi:hypothetical protein